MVYKASLDKTAIRITVLVGCLFFLIAGLQFVLPYPTASSFIPGSVTTFCLVIYFVAFLFRPASYIVTDTELIIRRPAWDIHVQRAEIKNIASIAPEKIGDAVRTFAVGGVFGYYGDFANRSIGRMKWFVTRRDRLVLINTTDNKNIILSPDKRDEFIAELSFNKVFNGDRGN